VVQGPLTGARSLGDGVGRGVRRSKGQKSLSFVQEQSAGMGPGAPGSQLLVKVGARAPVPYGVGATVSDILLVNLAGVIDVFSLYIRSTIVGLTCCYKAVVWLSNGL